MDARRSPLPPAVPGSRARARVLLEPTEVNALRPASCCPLEAVSASSAAPTLGRAKLGLGVPVGCPEYVCGSVADGRSVRACVRGWGVLFVVSEARFPSPCFPPYGSGNDASAGAFGAVFLLRASMLSRPGNDGPQGRGRITVTAGTVGPRAPSAILSQVAAGSPRLSRAPCVNVAVPSGGEPRRGEGDSPTPLAGPLRVSALPVCTGFRDPLAWKPM